MSEVWNKVYKSDDTFFGEEPSNFALLCFNHMKANNVKKVLELGAGHGRDTIFFASNGIEEIQAVDYSTVAIVILDKVAKKRGLPIKSQTFDVAKNPLPFADGYFDAVYSHMLFNMRFSEEELHFAFSELNRVLKPYGLNFFSVRNHNDKWILGGGNPSIVGIHRDRVLSDLLSQVLSNESEPSDTITAHNAKLLIGFNSLDFECSIVTRGIRVSSAPRSTKTFRLNENQCISINPHTTGDYFDTTHVYMDPEHNTLTHLDLKTACFYMDWDNTNKNWKYDIAVEPNDLRKKIGHFRRTISKFDCTSYNAIQA